MTDPDRAAEKADAHITVLENSVAVMAQALNDFVGACMDAEQKPQAPDRGALMRARAMLPPRFTHALGKKP